jgi:hypothetical protein
MGASAYHCVYSARTMPVNAAIVTQTHVRAITSRHPARSSCATEAATRTAPRARGWTLASSIALTTNVAASSRNASPAPTPSTSAVETAGPTMIARFCVDAVSAVASRISGSGTVCGIRPV